MRRSRHHLSQLHRACDSLRVRGRAGPTVIRGEASRVVVSATTIARRGTNHMRCRARVAGQRRRAVDERLVWR